MKKIFIFLIFFGHLCAEPFLIEPLDEIINPCAKYTLINSVDFHPQKNIFCATFTHGDKVGIYKINSTNTTQLIQILENPIAKLSAPQHAVFSANGEHLIVANWINQSVTIYKIESEELFNPHPIAVIPTPKKLRHCRPHGVACSPCGKFLAIAYGAAYRYGKAIALFSINPESSDCKLITTIQNPNELPGIPKGITFSPDGNCLLVTFSDLNRLTIFDLDAKKEKILPTPRQTIQGQYSAIFRPEDVKISADGKFCAISNSDQHTVTFYPFDKISNKITQLTPCYTLQSPVANFYFPHGIAFSPIGSLLTVTEFGHITITKDGDITWDDSMPPQQAKINLFKISNN